MKKLLLGITSAAFLTIFSASTSNAQIQKGNYMVGANLANFDLGFQTGNTTFSIAINPKVGYFVQNNVAIGAEVLLGLGTGTGYTNVDYGFGAFGRYYVGQKEAVLLKHARFFAEANFGIRGFNHKATGLPAATTNGLGLGFGPGVAYFITPNIGLEALLKYNANIGFGNAPIRNQLAFNLGFQIYLPSKKVNSVYKEVVNEVKSK